MKEHEFSNIKDQVKFYIDGRHGRIGIIVPERESTEEEIRQLHKDIAEIVWRSTKKKLAKE